MDQIEALIFRLREVSGIAVVICVKGFDPFFDKGDLSRETVGHSQYASRDGHAPNLIEKSEQLELRAFIQGLCKDRFENGKNVDLLVRIIPDREPYALYLLLLLARSVLFFASWACCGENRLGPDFVEPKMARLEAKGLFR